MPKYIDCTPTWEGILSSMLMVIEHGESQESKIAMRAELYRMARLADKYVEIVKAKENNDAS